METKFSFGRNITSANELMETVGLADLYGMISKPGTQLSSQQAVLRSVMDLDMDKYRQLKKSLPYFVCASFEPNVRRKENFASTSSFVLDIDHCEREGRQLEDIKAELAADERVAMIFVSPGGCGLKLLFLLDEPCRDTNVYSSFYRKFAGDFAVKHNIADCVDMRTCDVSRACFLAFDPECILNTTAIPVHVGDYADMESVDVFVKDCQETEKAMKSLAVVAGGCADPDRDTMDRIKAKLDTGRRRRQEIKPLVCVPAEVQNIMEGLKGYVEETGAVLYETRAIQYGIKLCFRTATHLAELNLFYGKKGFTVSASPKRGTYAELNGMLAELVRNYIDEAVAW